ncbi:ChuT ABC-type hemin transport system, periplasmic component [Rhabdaerophilaceae bacterium]
MCTDQLLLDLSDPAQIVGLSPFAADFRRSWAAGRAESFPRLSGTAEEVMVIKPDLVVSGRFTRQATHAFIRAHNIAIEEFEPARSIAESRQQILRFGEITGGTARAAARVAELDAAVLALRSVAKGARLRVLPLSRRGWVAGSQSLVSDLLVQAGLINSGSELGLKAGGFASLEAIATLKPDAILVSQADRKAEDQGSAMLLHPAIEMLFPPERRIILPERLTVCGGPMLVEAMQQLARQIESLKTREAAPLGLTAPSYVNGQSR